MFAVVGLGAMLLTRLVWTAAYPLLFSRFYAASGSAFGGMNLAMIAVRAVDGLITAGCWALILAAIFSGRQEKRLPTDIEETNA